MSIANEIVGSNPVLLQLELPEQHAVLKDHPNLLRVHAIVVYKFCDGSELTVEHNRRISEIEQGSLKTFFLKSLT